MKDAKLNISDHILKKAHHYCAYQERCLKEITQKLREWKVQQKNIDKIIAALIRDDFINEERFARTFASGKFRSLHWGKNKIIHELQQRQVPDLYIQIGLQEIDDIEYHDTLKNLLIRKNKEISGTNPAHRKKKLITYAVGKGYRFEQVIETLSRVLHE